MSTQNNNGFRTYLAGETLLEGTRVKMDTTANQVVYADASDVGIGIIQQDVASGSYAVGKAFNDPGTALLRVNDASVTAGDALYAAADGEVTTTANNYLVGYAIEAGTEANQLLECAINVQALEQQSSATHYVFAAGIHDWAGGAATADSIGVTGILATDVVQATLVARAGSEVLELAAIDAGDEEIDLTLSANGTDTTTKVAYTVFRAV